MKLPIRQNAEIDICHGQPERVTGHVRELADGDGEHCRYDEQRQLDADPGSPMGLPLATPLF